MPARLAIASPAPSRSAASQPWSVLPIYLIVLLAAPEHGLSLQYPPDLLPIHTTLTRGASPGARALLPLPRQQHTHLGGSPPARSPPPCSPPTRSPSSASRAARAVRLFLACTIVPFEAPCCPTTRPSSRSAGSTRYQALNHSFLALSDRTFLLRQAFLTVPPELVDAASIDGYGHPGILIRSGPDRPADDRRARRAVLSRRSSQYLWPLVVTDSTNHRTVQIGLRLLNEDALGGGRERRLRWRTDRGAPDLRRPGALPTSHRARPDRRRCSRADRRLRRPAARRGRLSASIRCCVPPLRVFERAVLARERVVEVPVPRTLLRRRGCL